MSVGSMSNLTPLSILIKLMRWNRSTPPLNGSRENRRLIRLMYEGRGLLGRGCRNGPGAETKLSCGGRWALGCVARASRLTPTYIRKLRFDGVGLWGRGNGALLWWRPGVLGRVARASRLTPTYGFVGRIRCELCEYRNPTSCFLIFSRLRSPCF